MMQRALALLLALGGLAAADSGANPLPPMIDAHAHYSAPDAAAFPPEAIVARLDAAGVRRLVVTSSPPHLAQQLYRHAPERVIPLLGVYDSYLNKANWVHDAGLPARVAAQLQDGAWAGIGELHLFGGGKQAGPDGSRRRRGGRAGVRRRARAAAAVGASWHRASARFAGRDAGAPSGAVDRHLGAR
jgi:hypothetical protein